MAVTSGGRWDFLSDCIKGLNSTAVYIELCEPSDNVKNSSDALHHLRTMQGIVRGQIISAPNQAVRIQVCISPKIVVGRTPPRVAQEAEDLKEILYVLHSNGVEVEMSPPNADDAA